MVTSRTMSTPGRAQYSTSAFAAGAAGLPEANRSSISFLPPNSDRLPAAWANSLQSKVRPASNTSRSVKPRLRAAARTASAASSASSGSSPCTT